MTDNRWLTTEKWKLKSDVKVTTEKWQLKIDNWQQTTDNRELVTEN